jgi:isoamylase
MSSVGMRLAGDLIDEYDSKGEKIVGDTLLILMNAHHESVQFALPVANEGHRWERLLDTASDAGGGDVERLDARQVYPLQARSLALFRTIDSNAVSISAAQLESIRQDSLRRGIPLAGLVQ